MAVACQKILYDASFLLLSKTDSYRYNFRIIGLAQEWHFLSKTYLLLLFEYFLRQVMFENRNI